nr:hypothetical protein [Tanacetum cinerariifolium]
MEQMTQLTSMCEMACQIVQKKQEEKRIEEEQAASARYWKIPACCDDEDNYDSAITPILSTKEPIDSLSMGDEHLDTIPATESDKVIKSSVEDLILIPSEFEGIPDTMCDVHLDNNHTPLEAKDHFEIVINSKDDISSSDSDSLYNENIEYVEASPYDSELVILEVAEIVIPKEEEIEDDNLREKLLNKKLEEKWIEEEQVANAQYWKIPVCCDDDDDYNSAITPVLSTKEPGNSLSMGDEHLDTIPATKSDEVIKSSVEDLISIPSESKEISSGSTTTYSDISLSEYDSSIFDLSNDQYPLTDRSDFTHEEFANELVHIISPPEYECFYFRSLPDPGELISILNFGIRENLSTTRVNLPIEDDHSPLLAYVVWIFLAYLVSSMGVSWI